MAKKRSNSRSSSKRTAQATRGGTSSRSRSSRKSASRRSSSKRSTSRKKRTRAEIKLNVQQKGLVVGIVLIFFALILTLSIFSPSQGELTAFLERLLFRLFGWGGYGVPLLLAGGGFYLVLWGMDQPPQLPFFRMLGLGLLLLVFEAFATLIPFSRAGGAETVWDIAARGAGGGYLGGLLAEVSIRMVDFIGAVFIFLILGVIGTILLTGVSRADLGALLVALFRRSGKPATATAGGTGRSRIGALLGGDGAPPAANPPAQPPLPLGDGSNPPAAATAATAADPVPFDADAATETAEESPAPRRRGRRGRKKKEEAPAPETAPAPVILGQTGGSAATGASWTLPVLAEFLDSGSELDISHDSIREQVEIIEHTLESFGAPATVVDINQGPTVTQYGVEPQFLETRGGKRTKVKVGKIAGLADDLALALAAHSVRIQAPVPGKGYVGIEVPNPMNALVSLRDVMESREYQKIKSPLRIGLGQNVAGQPIGTDLTKMPHLLIAGTTGSGKSVCVNGIIACLLLQNTPDDLKFVMVDPKRVELTGYNGIPHLAAPVVVDMDRVVGVLQWAMREMDSRYQRFADSGVRNIDEYNKKMARRKEQKLPYIVIVIDELADLMMLAPDETERGVSRLAQMARATGMHMVIATQRPSVDVVTGLIKANFPARIAFAVASATDSRVILDQTGAERLLGRGDMLFQSPDAAAPVRLQGCYVSDRELDGLIDYWKTARRYNLITAADAQPRQVSSPAAAEEATTTRADTAPAPPAVEEAAPEAAAESAAAPVEEAAPPAVPATPAPQQPLWEDLIAQAQEEPEYDDELMPEAINLVQDLGKASTSLLQRRFRIGYTRAARLIDNMEEMGIIGPPTGTSKAREVYPPADETAAVPSTNGSAAAADGEGDGADDGDDVPWDEDA